MGLTRTTTALILFSVLLTLPVSADELDGVLGIQSEGSLSVGLNILPRFELADGLTSEAMEIGRHRLPAVIAQSLLSDSRVTIGVCLPHTYSEGFSVASFSDNGSVPHVKDLAGNHLGYGVSQSRDWESLPAYVSVRDSGCVRKGSSQVTINLNPLGRLQPKIILGKFNLLVKPE